MVNFLLVLVALGMLLGLIGIWFPHLFKNDVGWKLFGTFVVLIVGTGVATGLLKFLAP